MKKEISRLLLRLAKWIYPPVTFDTVHEARPIGLCIHISKKDVRNFRKNHQEVDSHRKGLELLIEEAKWRIAGAIGRGMIKNDVINFDVKKTLYVADVSGIAFVYGKEE